ncbi:carbamoyltransferase N-terminal domain-containing protein [Paenibacillus bouchesdurhonensis]|uniref:carbamoyltransferase N-terminal domain-containing protein n=1 Tax=Paenibacillus bouchesdurhonensis TaxID=1870990 RepID=UPI000DA60F2E|nr:carbamoyltransferase N-terminal domain-containing protein [Paenibacillus bouchesdurhonensis]
MITCGIKLTHDGAVALLEDNKLIFCVEMEKTDNNPRFQEISDTETITVILNSHGYSIDDIDHFAIDGWGGSDADALAVQPRLEIGKEFNWLAATHKGEQYKLGVGQYEEPDLKTDVLRMWQMEGLRLGGQSREYTSYLHVATHILSTYFTSPFAKEGRDSYVLVWDGGMYPRLYYVDTSGKIENMGPIFLLIGNIYTIFAQHFGPYKVNGKFAKDNLSVAGKVMAYIAKGTNREELHPIFDKIYRQCYSYPMGFANVFANEFKKSIEGRDISDEDILCSFHFYLENMILQKLRKKIERFDRGCRNLCVAGGCGLNIKWNSALRNSGLFNAVYVAPFPNDSGSAIGAACCALYHHSSHRHIEWNVYSGNEVIENMPPHGWVKKEFSVKQLADLIYETNEPVVVLKERAELGPRALGNRSIVAAPFHPDMKELLNQIKDREDYRPVSPICIEERAQQFFSPGTPTPYMLFDHVIKEEWRDKLPAVMHLDGSARLQTMNESENPVFYKLLEEFEKLSGFPILCNTSANYNGKGFFPDICSAAEWGKVNYIWSNGYLYEKESKIKFSVVSG